MVGRSLLPLSSQLGLSKMEELSAWHLPLIGYFVLIAGLISLLIPALFTYRTLSPFTTSSLLHTALGVTATFFTWRHMLQYMSWSKQEAATRAGVEAVSIAQWLEATSLFQEAWLQVCKTTTAWWWSEQLCAWTVGPLTIFMAIEGVILHVSAQTKPRQLTYKPGREAASR